MSVALQGRLDRYGQFASSSVLAGSSSVDHGETPSVDQLLALQQVDAILPPEEADLEARVRAGRFGNLHRSSDDLRLPPPPRPRVDGPELMRATHRTFERFMAHARQPVGADPEAVGAEARMMAVLGGISRLQEEFRARADREQMV